MDLFQAAFDNTAYRRVLFTGEYCQLAIMSLPAGETLQEDLTGIDKIVLVLVGHAEALCMETSELGKKEQVGYELKEGHFIGIPSGMKHIFRNAGPENLKLVVVYAPPQFLDSTVHATIDAAIFDPMDNPSDEEAAD